MKIRLIVALGLVCFALVTWAEEKDDDASNTEREIALSELPQAIKSDIAAKYPGFKIKEAEISEVNGKVTYEVEIKKYFKVKELLYNQQGQQIKEGKDEDDEEDIEDDDSENDKD